MMPLPQLLDGLGRNRIEVVRKALAMHLMALKAILTRNPWEDSVSWTARVEDHLSRMAVFFETIVNHAAKTENISIFTRGVILHTLDHIDVLMKELQSAYASRTLQEHKKAIEEMLTFHANQLQRMLDSSAERSQTTIAHVHASVPVDENWVQWESMSDEEVVRTAVLNADSLQSVERFLLSKRNWNKDDWKSRFVAYVDKYVLELLRDQQMKEVKLIFCNMSWDTDTKLKSICLKTDNSDIRNHLALELNELHLLTHTEVDAWKFLLSLEQIMKDKNLTLSDDGKVLKVLDTSSKTNTLSIESLMNIEPQTEWRKITSIQLYFETLDRTLEPSLDMEMTWKYLLTKNEVSLLKTWIDAAHKTSASDMPLGTSNRLEALFSSWHLPQHMVDCVSSADCNQLTIDEVLDHLSRYGVYTTEESSDVRRVLFRMAQTGRLMDTEKINEQILEFIIQNNLPDLLAASNLNAVESTIDWVDLYKSFKNLTQSVDSKKFIYECVRITSQFLKSSYTADSILALGLLLLSSNAIRDVYEQPDLINSVMNKDELFSMLKTFPKLLQHLTDNSSLREKDLTTSQLLKEHFSFELDHLLRCDLSSSCPSRKGDDAIWEELPHFSSEALIERYGHFETLSFRYYLKQGRPSFAASFVLADQILSFGKFSRKLLKKLCYSAHGLSLRHFTNPQITSSCAAFIEMLGGSSVTQRVHIAAANLVLSAGKFQGEDELIVKEDLLHMLQNIALGERLKAAEKFVAHVEGVAVQEKGFSCIKAQGLATRLAAIHHLPQPCAFLHHCASRNDWITFLLVCEMYNYPLDVVKKSSVFFKCSSLRQHLEHVWSRMTANFKTPPSTVPSVTSRHHYYSKVFKQKAPSSSGSEQNKSNSSTSPAVTSTATHTDALIDQLAEKKDLFYVLLACSKVDQPAITFLTASLLLPSPILAVLAVCMEPSWSWCGFCTWLASWLPHRRRLHFEERMRIHLWSAEDMESALLDSLEMGQAALVVSAFRIFLPDNALAHIAEAINESANKKLYYRAASSLKRFRHACQVLDESKVPQFSEGASFLEDSKYLFDVALQMICKALEACFLSSFDQRRFLLIVLETNLFDGLADETLNAQLLLNIMDVLLPLNLNLNLKNWFKNHSEEIKSCIDTLVQKGYYRQAAKIAMLAGAEVSSIMVAEQNAKFERCLQSTYKDVKTFCRDCIQDFQQVEMDPASAHQFLYGCVSRLQSNDDRWLMLHAALQWLPDAEVSTQLEIELWKYCLQADSDSLLQSLKEELTPTPLNKLHSEHLDISITHENTHASAKLSSEEQDRLLHLIDMLLDIGDLASVCRLKSLFGAEHRDLIILTSCINLVEGHLSTSTLLSTHPSMVESPLGDSGKVGSSNIYTPSESESDLMSSLGSDFELIPPTGKKEALSVLQRLCGLLQHGRQIGLQLSACYHLAVSLDLSYKDVTTVAEPLKLLRSAVSDVHSVASDIIRALKLSPNDAAQFISQEVISAISKKPSEGGALEYVMWGCDLETNFHRVIDLVPDQSLLGNKLLNMVWKLTTPNRSIPRGVLITAAELLIRSHDCYTAACSMEGIANVLHGVSSLSTNLCHHSEWALMVRLLTGIQRYTEMSYIFKMLKENDQFEFLLRKDAVKPPSLKVAILDWLRRECPNDRALLKMTAAHFKMHCEEASLWETEGKQRLQTLVTRGLSNDDETKSILNTALQDFSHAAECYLQANMVNHAVASAHQAELIALQIYFVTSASDQPPLRLLLLDSKTVAQLITNSLSFPEARIVARAYNHHTDWGAALYHHCVTAVSGAEKYFSAWNSSLELTPSLIQDVVRRYQRAPVVTHDMASNMRRLLSHVEDIDVRYKLASELGFKDFVEDLLQAPEVVYLKDTVWQVGFKL